MADTKISALTAATVPVAGSEVFPIVQSSTTKKLTLRQIDSYKPAFSAVPATTQSFSSNSSTKVTFGTENFDTAGNFASSRFTPTVAGYYQINANVQISATVTALAGSMSIYKNGSAYLTLDLYPYAATMAKGIGSVISMNGTTDYLEVYVYVFDNGGAPVVQTASSFSGALLIAA